MATVSDHPLFQRISHWINLICFIVFIPTGFIIHSPFQGADMALVRGLHFFFMYVFLANGIVRVYYAVFGKHKDYKDILLNKQDLKTFIPQLKYYLFISKKHPKTGKYNPLQKCAYLALPVLGVLQAITGFILYLPMKFAGAAMLLGGMGAVRGIHYIITWLFILIIIAHLYLVFTEAAEQFMVMFFGKTSKKSKQHPAAEAEQSSANS
ncbi:Ni/Fe-hydrogenase, b-type cytochrome subunit [Dehalobacter sp. DCM]|uniref:Ni/Fe-hydrogenase, b-type cytochrome subunit n=1 Tax=Dehalobacter sp. DCM TaxID=2907827 RepID=UPI0030818733|nr:Ni/Fe-hydrogenase, b-type cytochrome subunit [Dehalobacter sp. DCM]